MCRQILIVQPDTESLCALEWFALFVKLFVVGQVEIVDIPAGSDRLIDLLLLLWCWIDLCFVCL